VNFQLEIPKASFAELPRPCWGDLEHSPDPVAGSMKGNGVKLTWATPLWKSLVTGHIQAASCEINISTAVNY